MQEARSGFHMKKRDPPFTCQWSDNSSAQNMSTSLGPEQAYCEARCRHGTLNRDRVTTNIIRRLSLLARTQKRPFYMPNEPFGQRRWALWIHVQILEVRGQNKWCSIILTNHKKSRAEQVKGQTIGYGFWN